MFDKNGEKVEALLAQLQADSFPDFARLEKTNLLRYIYSTEEGYEDEAMYWAKETIKLGTTLARNTTNIKEIETSLDMVKAGYFTRGRRYFDDYMIASEWDRAPNARFWLPRRKVLEGQHGIATALQDFFDDPAAKFLSLSLPAGTGKTTLIKFMLAFITGIDPTGLNMYVSYSSAMVKLMLDSLRSMLTTPEYNHNGIFGVTKFPDISAEYSTVSYRRPGDFPSVGLVSLEGSVTGRTRANRFLVTDDLVKNSEVANSPERLEKLYSDYKTVLTTRMIGEKTKQIMLGTIWSIHDPISRMQAEHENDPRYRFIAIPIEDEDGKSNFLYEHPDRYTEVEIQALRESLSPVDFACLCMQRPIEKEGLVFAPDNLQYYNGVLPDGDPDNIFFVTDVAWGGGDNLSMPILYEYGGEWYLHDVVYDNRDKTHTKPRVVGKILQHKCRMGRFEANNGGDEYADDVSKMLREVGYSCNISHKKAPTNMSKLTRIEQHAPNIKKIYFRNEGYRDDDYKRFMRDLTSFSFTAKNKHDDAPDSLGMAVDFRMGGRLNVVTRMKRGGNL